MRSSIRYLVVAVLALGSGSPIMVSASSCRPYLERYYMLCRESACKGAFRVSEIPSFGSCGRRMEVVAADDATNRLLASLLEHSRPHASGVFRLEFRLHWPRVEQQLIAALARDLELRYPGLSEDGKVIDVTSAHPGKVAALMTRAYGPDWIEQTSTKSTDEAVKAERQKFEQTAAQALLRNAALWSAFWGSFLVVLAVFIHSIRIFFLRVHRHAENGNRSLLTPLLMQAAVGIACICVPFLTCLELWPGVFLLPALATILLAEAWAWFRDKHPAPARTT